MLVPTWLHCGSQNPPKSRLGGLLGRLESVLGRLRRILERLGGVLEASWTVLGASWGILGRLGASWPRFEAQKGERGRWFGAQLWPGENTISLKKRTYRPLQTPLQQTQTRSWAASGPVRIQSAAKLRTRHRAACLITSWTVLYILAQNLWWMKNESIMTSDDLVMI